MKKSLPEFKKSGFAGKTASVVYPYSAYDWRYRDCFEVYILDGGAFFFSNDYLGSATGDACLRAWEDGRLFAPWLRGKLIEWDRFAPDTGANTPPRLEQHVWLNRLYFLLPLAQAWFRTGEKRFAESWFRLLTAWLKAHPPADPLSPAEKSRYCWFDMQPTTRLLVLIHSAYLLSKGNALPPAAWRQVYKAILTHACHVHAAARDACDYHWGSGNHYQQKGAALIYAGVLFPEFTEAREWVDTGRRVLADHAEHEILEDGASIEGSPSYSHFIARLCLDAHILLTSNGHPALPGWEKILRRQYAFLARTCDPKGMTLQISDSYSMNAIKDIEFARARLPSIAAARRGGSRWFNSGKVGVLRNKLFDATIDAMPAVQWHHHYGKPNLILFMAGEPLFIDTGCPNYDDDIRQRWCKTAAAHNTVTVEPLNPGTDKDGNNLSGECLCLKHNRNEIEILYKHRTKTFNYDWKRRVVLTPETCRITDLVRSNVPVIIRLHLHLAPVNITTARNGRQANVFLKNSTAQINLSGQGPGFIITDRPATGPDNKWTRSTELTAKRSGKTACFDLLIRQSGIPV